MFVDAQSSEVAVEQQFLWINVDRRLPLALRTHVPLGVHKTPEIRPCTTDTVVRRAISGNFLRKVSGNFPLLIHRRRRPYDANAEVNNKKVDTCFYSRSVHGVYSTTFISLFLTTVILLLLFAKHRFVVIVRLQPHTATMHNKFPKILRNIPPNITFPENLEP